MYSHWFNKRLNFECKFLGLRVTTTSLKANLLNKENVSSLN